MSYSPLANISPADISAFKNYQSLPSEQQGAKLQDMIGNGFDWGKLIALKNQADKIKAKEQADMVAYQAQQAGGAPPPMGQNSTVVDDLQGQIRAALYPQQQQQMPQQMAQGQMPPQGQPAPQMPPQQMAQAQMPTQQMAHGGLAQLPVTNFRDENYAGGGIVAFNDGGVAHGVESLYIGSDGAAMTREQMEAKSRPVDPARALVPAEGRAVVPAGELRQSSGSKALVPVGELTSSGPVGSLTPSGVRAGKLLDAAGRGLGALASPYAAGVEALMYSPDVGAGSDVVKGKAPDQRSVEEKEDTKARAMGTISEISAELGNTNKAIQDLKKGLNLNARKNDPEKFKTDEVELERLQNKAATLKNNYEAAISFTGADKAARRGEKGLPFMAVAGNPPSTGSVSTASTTPAAPAAPAAPPKADAGLPVVTNAARAAEQARRSGINTGTRQTAEEDNIVTTANKMLERSDKLLDASMKERTPEDQDKLDTAAGEKVQKKHDEALVKAGLSPKAYEDSIRELKDQAVTARKNRDTDHLMAAAAGFFAMAGGTSPYALKNMADGFGVSVKNVMEAEKTYRASEKDRQTSLTAYKQAQRAEVLGLEDKKAAYILEGRKAEERVKANQMKFGELLGVRALDTLNRRQTSKDAQAARIQAAEIAAGAREDAAALNAAVRQTVPQQLMERYQAAVESGNPAEIKKVQDAVEFYQSTNPGFAKTDQASIAAEQRALMNDSGYKQLATLKMSPNPSKEVQTMIRNLETGLTTQFPNAFKGGAAASAGGGGWGTLNVRTP